MIPSKRLNSSIWLINGTLRGTTITDHSEPGSNVSEGVFHILQTSKTGASPPDVF